MFTHEQLTDYINEVLETGSLEYEISKIRELMIRNTKNPDKQNPDKVKTLNQLFKVLLYHRDLLHTTTKIDKCV